MFDDHLDQMTVSACIETYISTDYLVYFDKNNWAFEGTDFFEGKDRQDEVIDIPGLVEHIVMFIIIFLIKHCNIFKNYLFYLFSVEYTVMFTIFHFFALT